PRASATSPGRLKRTCPRTTRWSMTAVYIGTQGGSRPPARSIPSFPSETVASGRGFATAYARSRAHDPRRPRLRGAGGTALPRAELGGPDRAVRRGRRERTGGRVRVADRSRHRVARARRYAGRTRPGIEAEQAPDPVPTRGRGRGGR